MTATNESESRFPSRRALLAGALGGVGAWAASALGRVDSARAGGDGDVVLGQGNYAATSTYVINITNSETPLGGLTNAGTGVIGVSTADTGLLGFSGSGLAPSAKGKTGAFGYANQDAGSKGMWGSSPKGHGIHGQTDTGWAGYFDGRIFGSSYLELRERSNPSAPTSNRVRLYVRDNGSGNTQLCVRFHNGVIRVLATA